MATSRKPLVGAVDQGTSSTRFLSVSFFEDFESSDIDNDSRQCSLPKRPKSALEELLGSTIPCNNNNSSEEFFHNNVMREIKLYREGGNIPLTSDPLQWWRTNQATFPNLAEQARKYLGIPGTSVPCERVFSTTGDIVSAQRNCLNPENVDMLTFLKKNMTVEIK